MLLKNRKTAATEDHAELPQEESTQEKYDRSLKKTRTGFGIGSMPSLLISAQ